MHKNWTFFQFSAQFQVVHNRNYRENHWKQPISLAHMRAMQGSAGPRPYGPNNEPIRAYTPAIWALRTYMTYTLTRGVYFVNPLKSVWALRAPLANRRLAHSYGYVAARWTKFNTAVCAWAEGPYAPTYLCVSAVGCSLVYVPVDGPYVPVSSPILPVNHLKKAEKGLKTAKNGLFWPIFRHFCPFLKKKVQFSEKKWNFLQKKCNF